MILVGPGSEWARLWMAAHAIAELVGLIAGALIVLSFGITAAWIAWVEYRQHRAQRRAQLRMRGIR